MKKNQAFTLIEILVVVVILAILAAIIIPQFRNAGIEAKASSLSTDLQRIRLQIELYRTRHNGNPPTLANFAAQMTGKTDMNGDTSGTDFGPYLISIPVEPFTGSNAISAADTEGWNYDETTRRFWAPYSPDN